MEDNPIDEAQVVEIDYTNWRGERLIRCIVPTGVVAFENNEWHLEPQWLLEAIDIEKDEIRMFAMRSIHSWKPRLNYGSRS
jgi:predicted DNA-binding transcriptional regulator YafY